MNNGGPEFPALQPPYNCSVKEGMTLRDYFAGQALSGIDFDTFCQSVQQSNHDNKTELKEHETLARVVYLVADAMIKERGSDE